jgi:perosamine synthetase
MRSFRNHGIDLDFRQREAAGRWNYAMGELGFNYRLSDIHAALALSQLDKLDAWTARRREIARLYDQWLTPRRFAMPLGHRAAEEHASHLYVVRWQHEHCGIDRDAALRWLRTQGIGVNVHYLPVYLHPYYQKRLQLRAGICPVAEQAYTEIMSLPIFPNLGDEQVTEVVSKLDECQRWAKVA